MNRSEKVCIGHLIIVTGPTSSGKSTLLTSILKGDLDEELKTLLPANAGSWEVYPCREYDGSVKIGESKEGLLLHYDFMRPFKKFLKGYHDDLASKLMDVAGKVTVLVIKPEKDRLLQQLQRGEFKGDKIKSGQKGLYLRKLLTRATRSIPGPVRMFIKNVLIPGRRRSLTDFNEILYFKYRENGWLEAWYDKFDTFLATKKEEGCRINVFYIRQGDQKSKNWCILEQKWAP